MIVATTADQLARGASWGTTGERLGARDWLTLGRILGWDVAVVPVDGGRPEPEISGRCIVLACDPGDVAGSAGDAIAAALAAGAMVIARASGAHAVETLGGRTIEWTGPGPRRTWALASALRSERLAVGSDAEVWATLDGAPLITARRAGAGVSVELGFDPGSGREAARGVTALLKTMLIEGPDEPVAWLDLTDTLILRMDDPGASAGVFLEEWAHPRLDEKSWAIVTADLLRRDARLTVGYVPGWLDDGSRRRGRLSVRGRRVRRIGGAVHASPDVLYVDRAGHAPGRIHDYASEFRGVAALRAAGAGDVELHGHTHVRGDGAAWARAPDRYTAVEWFQEFASETDPLLARLPPEDHPLARGKARLHGYFGVVPTTFVCPGQHWTPAILRRAHELGFELVAADGVAVRDGDSFCWMADLATQYLDKPEGELLASELPVVGYFHDREPALGGAGWIAHWLDRWSAAGVRRFVDFRELASALSRRISLGRDGAGWRLTVGSGWPPPRPFPVLIRARGTNIESALTVATPEGVVTAAAEPTAAGHLLVHLPSPKRRPPA